MSEADNVNGALNVAIHAFSHHRLRELAFKSLFDLHILNVCVVVAAFNASGSSVDLRRALAC